MQELMAMTAMLVRHEIQDTIALQEGQINRQEAENHTQITQAAQSTRIVFGNITRFVESELEPEVRIKKELVEMIKKTADWLETIMKSLIDSHARCRHNRDIFSNLYRNIILQQRFQLGQLNDQTAIFRSQDNKKVKIYFEKKLNEVETNLDGVVARYEVAKKQLNLIGKEKEETLLKLSQKDTLILELREKISDYEIEVKNLSEKLSKVFASLEIVREKKSQLKDSLLTKQSAMLKVFEKLEYERIKRDEETVELSSFRDSNVELMRKLDSEIKEREKMSKILSNKNELIDKLMGRVEKLREQTCCEWMQEFKRRFEHLEFKMKRIFEERERMNSLFKSDKDDEMDITRTSSCGADAGSLK